MGRCNDPAGEDREVDAQRVPKAVQELELFLSRNAYVPGWAMMMMPLVRGRLEVQTGKMVVRVSGLAVCLCSSRSQSVRFRKSGALKSRDDNVPDEELEMHDRLDAPVNRLRG